MWATDNLLLLTTGGSHAYGLATPTSDIDHRGVAFVDPDVLLGLTACRETHEERAPIDLVIHSLTKFLRLALNANPNIWDLLFCRESDVLYQTTVGQALRTHAEWFLSRKAAATFGGYAAAQLKHMANHNTDHGAHSIYFERYGYDTKNAMHLLRLLRMAREVLHTNQVNVYRSDREFLLRVKNGYYTESTIQTMAADLFQDCQDAEVRTILPVEPNFSAVNTWLITIHQRWIQGDTTLIQPATPMIA